MKSKLLILDDDEAILQLLAAVFEDENVEVFLETDSEAAVNRVISDHPNVAILDICLPKKSGLEVLQEIKRIDPGLSVIMTTGYRTTQNAIEAMKHGAYEYLTKPFDIGKMKDVVQKALECNLLNRKVRYAEISDQIGDTELEEDIMIGSSPQMIQIWKMVGKIADADASVLIQGASGTGKELLARAIYNNSRRCDKPFLAVNCAALPETLLESELFGHVKGSFSGAIATKQGLFEAAHQGTLFLDEIGNLSMETQGKLLRVLETKHVKKVGDTTEREINIRLISATNRDLSEMVREGEFREDLYYRLNVVPIYLPPLRDRTGDVPLLATVFLERFCKKNQVGVKGFSPEAMTLMESYSWPGNVRELRNIVERLAILCDHDRIEPRHLPEEIRRVQVRAASGVPLPRSWEEFKRLKQQVRDSAVQQLERRFLLDVLERCESNVSRAAEEIGIQRTNLHALLRKHGLT